MDFTNKIVLVTGASRGIGRSTAIAFARKGAKVVINYRSDDESAERTRKELIGSDHLMVRADVSNPDEVNRMFDEILSKYERLDVLVNNAGIGIEHPIDDISYESWQHAWTLTLNTNLIALANTCYQAAQVMMRQHYGRIVNVSSRGAFRGEPTMPAYGASKAGVNALSQSLAKQLGRYNIYVHAVAPGFVETDMAAEFLDEARRRIIENESPLGRIATPEEVANAILYLASDESAFSTGAILDINGASYLRT